MKTVIMIAFALLSLMQVKGQTLEFKNSQKILLEGQKKSKEQVFKIMENNPEALQLYKQGKSLRTWGDVTFFGGIGIALGGILLNQCTTIGDKEKKINGGWYGYSGYTYTEKDNTLSIVSAAIGGGLLIATIPLKISGKKKIKQSIEKYNNGLQSVSDSQFRKSSANYNWAVINNNKGLGVKLTF